MKNEMNDLCSREVSPLQSLPVQRVPLNWFLNNEEFLGGKGFVTGW